MENYLITVRKIVPLTEEELKRKQEYREKGRNYNAPVFNDFQHGLIPIDPDVSRSVPVLDVILTDEEYEVVKKAVIEVKK